MREEVGVLGWRCGVRVSVHKCYEIAFRWTSYVS